MLIITPRLGGRIGCFQVIDAEQRRLGLRVPTRLHAQRLDARIAAGPVSLAVTGRCTSPFYFNLAAWLP